jgi:hypothetical protein
MAASRLEVRPVAPVLESTYQFLLWLLPAVEKLPRSYKFSLGDRIVATALNLLDGLIAAAFTRRRGPLLAQANLDIDRLRYMFRLSADLRLIDLRRYEHAARFVPIRGGNRTLATADRSTREA